MPIPLEGISPYFEGIGIDRPCHTEFRKGDVPAVQRVTGLVFKDMARVLNMGESAVRDGRAVYTSVNKDKLCEWLGHFAWLTEYYMEPLMSAACGVAEEVEKLKTEKITDQKTIIALQEKVIAKKDRHLIRVQEAVKTGMQSYATTVETTCSEAVKTGMQSYASAVETKCSEAYSAKVEETVKGGIQTYASALESKCSEVFSGKKIAEAVKSAVQAEDRSRNVIIFGVEEQSNEIVEEKVAEIFSHLDEKPLVVQSSRMGLVPKAGRKRPIKVVLRGSDHVKQILRKSKNLKDIAACKTVFVCPDRSVEERQEIKKKVEERKRQRIEATAEITRVFIMSSMSDFANVSV